MRSSSSSKPVVAYKLNLHVFLLAPIEPILGLCGVPNGWCSRSASRLAISRWRRRNQTFKFQKFLPIKTRTLMARTQFIPLIYHRFPVSQTTRKLNHLFMTRIKKDSNRKSFFFLCCVPTNDEHYKVDLTLREGIRVYLLVPSMCSRAEWKWVRPQSRLRMQTCNIQIMKYEKT